LLPDKNQEDRSAFHYYIGPKKLGKEEKQKKKQKKRREREMKDKSVTEARNLYPNRGKHNCD